MDYETAKASRQALEDIKNGYDIEGNAKLLEEAFHKIIDRELERGEKRLRNVETTFLDYNPILEVTKTIHAMGNAKKYYAIAADEERRRENERQDLLHVLEFIDEPEEIRSLRAKEIAQVSKDRRVAKNFQELLKPFYSFVIKNPKILEDLKKLQTEMDRLDNNIKIRQYTPKERRDLDAVFNAPLEGVEME